MGSLAADAQPPPEEVWEMEAAWWKAKGAWQPGHRGARERWGGKVL